MRFRRLPRSLLAMASVAALGALASACEAEAARRPQLIVVVDTDIPVPEWVDRLAVEVFDGDGTNRIDERDYPLVNPSDWPLSFGIRHERPGAPLAFRLRLRAYSSERRLGTLAGSRAPVATGVANINPSAVIDRIALVRFDRSEPARVRITMRADCIGRPADVARGETCIDAQRPFGPAPEEELESLRASTPKSAVGTWDASRSVACDGDAHEDSGLHDADLCVPGGVFVFGDSQSQYVLPYSDLIEPVPDRVTQISPFFFDRHEVSVARFRAAMRHPTRPFVPPVEPTRPAASPSCNEGFDFSYCTWRGADAPADAANDEMPINCVPFETARAFCQWAGGDLPSEAQWEYAATRAFRARKTPFAWGDEAFSCDMASIGRWVTQASECGHQTSCGPLSVTAPFGGGPAKPGCSGTSCVRDETPGPAGGRGIVGLGGNVSEWVRDLKVPYSAPCWQNAPRLDPVCETEGTVTEHMFRGGCWTFAAWLTYVVIRTGGLDEGPLAARFGAVGFRCMRLGKKR